MPIGASVSHGIGPVTYEQFGFVSSEFFYISFGGLLEWSCSLFKSLGTDRALVELFDSPKLKVSSVFRVVFLGVFVSLPRFLGFFGERFGVVSTVSVGSSLSCQLGLVAMSGLLVDTLSGFSGEFMMTVEAASSFGLSGSFGVMSITHPVSQVSLRFAQSGTVTSVSSGGVAGLSKGKAQLVSLGAIAVFLTIYPVLLSVGSLGSAVCGLQLDGQTAYLAISILPMPKNPSGGGLFVPA